MGYPEVERFQQREAVGGVRGSPSWPHVLEVKAHGLHMRARKNKGDGFANFQKCPGCRVGGREALRSFVQNGQFTVMATLESIKMLY